MACSTTARGNRTRSPVGVQRQAVLEQAAAHLGAADLHPDLGQDPHRLVEDPLDQGRVHDGQLRSHAALLIVGAAYRRRSGAGCATRLMRYGIRGTPTGE